MISYVDDFRICGRDTAIKEVYQAMFAAWSITSCDGTRFLGLDVSYDRSDGRLMFSMSTYIQQTIPLNVSPWRTSRKVSRIAILLGV